MGKNSLKSDLYRIVSACKDSSGIYSAAADSTQNADLKATLSLMAVQRKSYCELLRREAWKEGINLSLSNSVSRVVLNYVDMLFHVGTGKDDYKILQACRAKEEQLVEKYDHVLTNEDLSINLHEILAGHQRLVREIMSEKLAIPAHA